MNEKIARELTAIAKEIMAGESDGELQLAARKFGVENLNEKVIKDGDASDAAGAEYGNPHTFSLKEMYDRYEDDILHIKDSYSDFTAWIEGITGGDGAYDWLDRIRTDLFTIDGIDGYTLDEAESIAVSKKGADIEIFDYNGEEWMLCSWCEDLVPESMLQEEEEIGPVCDQCVEAIESRGERLRFKDEY